MLGMIYTDSERNIKVRSFRENMETVLGVGFGMGQALEMAVLSAG